ncbi:MAG: DUF3347 domain-containing protein [Candidatus Cloacimonetes bacterium]|jgi:hypothetical protein|nr:DUF3347 domain-containing protein [Candidatus Cloacimonadota bacterium]MBT5419941.1 DUF3347 domain-containing protein [Candidatus Cloacimonadota bacterium]
MKKIIIVAAMIMTVLSLFAENSFSETMNMITAEYLKIKDTLAYDKTENVQENAKSILELTKKLNTTNIIGEYKDYFEDLPSKIFVAAKDLSKAKNIKSMREAFNDLSKPMAMWATIVKPSGINVAYCSMAPGSWLQTGQEILNPYYGASMLNCGEIVSEGAEEKHACTSECDHEEIID